MKNLNIYINESTSSKSLLSDFESNYDINKLSEKINDELKDAKVTLDINLGNYTTKLNTINNYKYNDLNKTINSLLSQLKLTKKDIIKIEKLPKDSNEVYLNATVIRNIAIAQKLNN